MYYTFVCKRLKGCRDIRYRKMASIWPRVFILFHLKFYKQQNLFRKIKSSFKPRYLVAFNL